jgi:hypothetical protein
LLGQIAVRRPVHITGTVGFGSMSFPPTNRIRGCCTKQVQTNSST